MYIKKFKKYQEKSKSRNMEKFKRKISKIFKKLKMVNEKD